MIKKRLEARLAALEARRNADFVIIRPEPGETWELAYRRLGLDWPAHGDTITIKRAYGVEVDYA